MVETIKRRSDRVLIALPVSVSGTDAAGKSFSEDTTTTTVSQYGGAIGMKTALVSGQEITIRRLRTSTPASPNATSRADRAACRSASLQCGVPATGDGILGIFTFPHYPLTKTLPGELCWGVRSAERAVSCILIRENWRSTTPIVNLRNCPQCGSARFWLEAEREAATRPKLRPAVIRATGALANNQRKHRRVAAEMPVCVRQAGADDDVASTVDISHGGLRFTSSRPALPPGILRPSCGSLLP